jgi:hydroxyethylthiazole kinase
MKLNDAAADLLDKIRQTAPLVHNITNFVVMNSSANMVLAVGASPVMAHSRHEVEEMAALASALVLNIGTLDEAWIDAMLLAARVANDRGIPVILDPVGAGATGYRSRSVQRILGEVAVTVIRGNGSEVFSLADTRVKTKGVDSSLSLSDDIVDAAGTIARQHGCIVAISGEKDLLTDGDRVMRVANGVPLMTRVTGMGCGLSAVTAAFCAVGGDDLLAASTAAFAIYGLCGQLAHQISDQPGSFSMAFVDALYTAGRDDIRDLLKVESYRKPPGR